MLTGVVKPESNLEKSIMENSKKAALHAEDVEEIASKEAKAGMKLEKGAKGLQKEVKRSNMLDKSSGENYNHDKRERKVGGLYDRKRNDKNIY